MASMLKTKVNIALAYLSLVEKYTILNVSNDAIIQESGLSRGTFYNNFKNQKEISDYIQSNIEIEVIIPIQKRLASFSSEQMNPDNVVLVISEILIPRMYERTNLFGKLRRCELNHLWKVPLLTVFENFVNPLMRKDREANSKVLVGYMLLILELWISAENPAPPAEFKIKFCQLINQSTVDLLEGSDADG